MSPPDVSQKPNKQTNEKNHTPDQNLSLQKEGSEGWKWGAVNSDSPKMCSLFHLWGASAQGLEMTGHCKYFLISFELKQPSPLMFCSQARDMCPNTGWL